MAQGAGLCERCRRAESRASARGSIFVLCGYSRTDPRYPRYPRLPVLSCPAYESFGDGLAQRDDSER